MKIYKDKQKHSYAVAEYMYTHADDYGLLPEDMYTLGLLHDIGYLYGRKDHEKNGSQLLRGIGIDAYFAFAIENHGRNPYTVLKNVGDITEDIPARYLLCLQEADMSVDKYGRTVGFKGRLKDIETRYGKDSDAYRTAEQTIAYIIENKPLIQNHVKKIMENIEKVIDSFEEEEER